MLSYRYFAARAVKQKTEMISKNLLSSIIRKARQVLQSVIQNKTQNVGVKVAKIPKRTGTFENVVTYRSQLPQNKLYNVWHNILPKFYIRSLARDLGCQAAWRSARNIPLLTFVGIVVAQHSEEEDEIVEKIHEFVKAAYVTASPLLQQLSLDQFQFGQQIGRGCNAVVYEAHFNSTDSCVGNEATDQVAEETAIEDDTASSNSEYTAGQTGSMVLADSDDDDLSDTDSDITILTLSDDDIEDDEKAPLVFPIVTQADTVYDIDSDSDISVLNYPDNVVDTEDDEWATWEFNASVDTTHNTEPTAQQDDDNIGICGQHGCSLSMSCSEILATFVDNTEEPCEQRDMTEDSLEDGVGYRSLNSSYSTETSERFNLAIKMMFNYGVESNADAIMREMERETVPARLAQTHGQMETWQNGNKGRKKRLPPHPNIVEMWGVFVDPVPHLPDSLLDYPAALPPRINPKGFGRNMTMFLVMKKYQTTLGEYLSTFSPSFRERLNLLAQLVEAVAHMRSHGIAHRDLKLDNIFLDTTAAGVPHLVLGDFGCCLANSQYGLKVPYPTEDMDRGGNTALMAPEISTAEPGESSYLDYSKSDMWATGALAYQILGADNPFYRHTDNGRLDSRTYSESELPPLPDDVPGVVQELVFSFLHRDPRKRPSARLAADMMQVLLWAPSEWTLPSNRNISRSEVKWWLISMATEVLLGAKSTERLLKRCFLENFNMNNLCNVFHRLGLEFQNE